MFASENEALREERCSQSDLCVLMSLQASRGQKLGRPENNKLVNFGVGAAEEGPAEEEGAHLISR